METEIENRSVLVREEKTDSNEKRPHQKRAYCRVKETSKLIFFFNSYIKKTFIFSFNSSNFA